MLQMIVTVFLLKVCDFSLEDIYCQESHLISLDVFREVGYAKDDNELTACLSLLATNTYEVAELLCQKYPWMEEIFAEITEICKSEDTAKKLIEKYW